MNNCEYVQKSPVPDLIYEEQCKNRVAELKQYIEDFSCSSFNNFTNNFSNLSSGFPPVLHRITLFTTYRCNLNCVYCKTIIKNSKVAYPARNHAFNISKFNKILAMYSEKSHIRHIHFTGGEATLVKDLPDMVLQANKFNIW